MNILFICKEVQTNFSKKGEKKFESYTTILWRM